MRNPRPPENRIRSLIVGQQSMAARSGMQLAANVTAIGVEYTATVLAAPDRVRFRYRLVGEQDEWIDAGHRRMASFSDLGPGDYRFELVAANEDGVWSRKPTVLDFSIAHAIYQTWWFRALALLLGNGLFPQERIEAIGGKLIVQSASGFGTIVELRIPARIAYA